jgi:hypothetical protein
VLQGGVFDIELLARIGALLDVSEAMIDLNTLQPVAERGATFEGADAEIGFDEDFLGKVFGAVGVAG